MSAGFCDGGFVSPYGREPFTKSLGDVTSGPRPWRLRKPRAGPGCDEPSIPCSLEAVAAAGSLDLSREYAQRRGRLENARLQLQAKECGPPLGSGLPPFSWLPHAIEEARAEVAAAEAELGNMLKLVGAWIEMQLRNGSFVLSGRADLTAPIRIVRAADCVGISFDDPVAQAVRLPDGMVLTDARLGWSVGGTLRSKLKPAQVRSEVASWIESMRAQGQDAKISKSGAWAHFADRSDMSRELVHKAVAALGVNLPRGRPRKPSST